jgi:uncharacterized membrane protein
MSDLTYQKLWEDEKNWGGGICGWYFCKEDPRLWVPKKSRQLGVSINLGHPRGGATLVAVFLSPVLVIIATILLTAAISKCSGHL